MIFCANGCIQKQMGGCLFGVSSPAPRRYHYVSESRTWLAAQSYCRTLYSDLATINSMEDMNSLTNEVDPLYIGAVWIGLKRGTQKRWGWSMGGDTLSQYSNWENLFQADCVAMIKGLSGKWENTICGRKLPFLILYKPILTYF
uniref:C-type lectin domain-containing protein n=1 Tax=Astyanax mexicanus TaxID=7994 RepID=A0A3B1JVF9_ASTMX